MKTKIGISIIIMLLLTATSFTVVNTIKADTINRGSIYPIEVVKKVWDGQNWVDNVKVNFSDTVRFNITVTYHKNSDQGVLAQNLTVNDKLPDNLVYSYNANYQPSYLEGNNVTWNLSKDYSIILQDNQSVSIEFDATAYAYGILINNANATGVELCCGWTLYGNDTATVTVGVPLDILKEVLDPQTNKWVKDLTSYVLKSEPLKFRITVTYNGYPGVDLLKCMFVEDYLPDTCIIYKGNVNYTYPDNQLFDNPKVTVSDSKNYVKFDWATKKFNLYAGQSIVIEFDTTVVQYAYDTVKNCCYAEATSCSNCQNPVVLSNSDCASIRCYPPNSAIQKKVLDPKTQQWVEETTVYVNDTVTFKIDLTYYGNYNLTNISILDQLPPSMEYAGNSTITPDVEGNQIWWNLTNTSLNDSETTSIEFNAKAIGGTGTVPGMNIAYVTAYEQGHLFESSDTAGVIVKTNLPPCPPDIKGDEIGIVNQDLTYYSITGDMDGDNIYYIFDWGDGTFSNWLGPYQSLGEVKTTHSWSSAGTYNVRSKAKDVLGAESMWAHYPVVVKISVPPQLSLNVTIKRGLAFSVSASIQNNGEAALNNIAWTLTVNRRGIIQKSLFNDSGTIASLNVGGVEKLTGAPFGFGLIKITVKVTAAGINPIQVTANGFIFTRLIYVNKS